VADKLKRPLSVVAVSLAVLAVTIALMTTVESLPALITVVVVNAVFLQVCFGPRFAVPLRHADALSRRESGARL
jgi:hypothetical protein